MAGVSARARPLGRGAGLASIDAIVISGGTRCNGWVCMFCHCLKPCQTLPETRAGYLPACSTS